MKKQIIFIWGWEAKENYKNFADYLEKFEYNPYEEKRKKWTDFFAKNLWEDFEVLRLPMPQKYFADYCEWKVIFEKVFPYLKKEVIFVWHSLWWSFLVKYFNELPLSSGHLPQGTLSWASSIHLVPQWGRLTEKIKKIFLLAPAFKDCPQETIWSFNFDHKLENLQNFSEKITILHSKDDFVVPFSDFLDFKKALPKAEFIEFKDKNHFLDEEFEEFLEIVSSI